MAHGRVVSVVTGRAARVVRGRTYIFRFQFGSQTFLVKFSERRPVSFLKIKSKAQSSAMHSVHPLAFFWILLPENAFWILFPGFANEYVHNEFGRLEYRTGRQCITNVNLNRNFCILFSAGYSSLSRFP